MCALKPVVAGDVSDFFDLLTTSRSIEISMEMPHKLRVKEEL